MPRMADGLTRSLPAPLLPGFKLAIDQGALPRAAEAPGGIGVAVVLAEEDTTTHARRHQVVRGGDADAVPAPHHSDPQGRQRAPQRPLPYTVRATEPGTLTARTSTCQ